MTTEQIPPGSGYPIGELLAEVMHERLNQLEKWGVQDHTPAHWYLILAEEVGEVSKELTKSEVPPAEDEDRLGRLRNARAELVQVAATATAFVESLDRNELNDA